MGKNYVFSIVLLGLLLGIGVPLHAALNGTYTINAGAPASATNYQSVTAAVSDLMSGVRSDAGPVNGPGVSGPVTLRIAAGSGPYNEQVSIGAITGTSATNYVRLTGGPTRETLQFTNTTTTDRHVVRLTGTKNIILDSLTLVNNGATYGYGVWITNNADSNVVQNSLINVSTTSTSANFCGIAISGSSPTTTGNNGDYNTVQNNIVTGGYYGYSCNGTSTTVFSTNNHVINNEFRDFYYYGIRHYEQTNAIIRGNNVHARTTGTTAGYGMYIVYNDRFTIERNWVHDVGTYCLYFSNANYQGGAPTSRASVRNNLLGGTMLLATTPYGIYATTNTTNVDFFHNSVSLVAGNGRAIYLLSGSGNDIRNNSFSIINSTTGYAAYVSSTAYVSTLDYNNYYAPGSSNFIYVGAAYSPGTYIGGGGYNLNSQMGDPNYINPASDLHAYAAQLFDAGDPTAGVTEDYDGEARPHPISSIPDIGADEYLPDSLDIGTTMLLSPVSYLCPDSAQQVQVVINNKGLNTLTNIPVSVNITGFVTATLNYVHPGPMPLGDIDTVTVGTINTWQGGSLTFEAYTALVGDQSTNNDTLVATRIINVTPLPPTATADTVCAGDSTSLVASSTGSNFWYDASQGGTLLASGDTLGTGPLGANATYWVEARGRSVSSLSTTYANNNSCGGGNMFDITAINEITIDSFATHLQNTGTVSTVDIYYRVGGFAGFETNAAAWTLLGSATVTSAGVGIPTKVPVGGLTIPSGQTYGIYLYNANVVYTTLSATTAYSNSDLSITCGVGLCSLFGGTNNPRGWNGTVYYNALGCSSSRTPVTVEVNPSPVVALADTSHCGPTTLDAGSAQSYQWSTGDSTQSIVASSSGTYVVTVTNALGCSAQDSAAVTILATPSVNLGNDTLLCNGASLLLDAGSNPGGSYAWSTGDTSQTISVTSAGTYGTTVTSVDGCEGSDGIVVTTLNAPAGSIAIDTSGCPDITFTGGNTGGAAAGTTWYFGDGGTSSGSSTTHTYAANGTYTVSWVQENGCGMDSVTTTLTLDCVVGTVAATATGVSLSPNPTRGDIRLSLSLPTDMDLQVRVTDVHGRTVLQSRQLLASGNHVLPMDLAKLSAGVYVIDLDGEGLQWQGRIVKE